MNPKIKLMIDSGAYTAWTQKKIIDVKTYGQFLIDKKDYIDYGINLDVIDPQGPDVAAKAGRDNFLALRDMGVHSIPVFHAREKLKWLDYMMDECDYIGLSGTSLVSPSEHMQWYHHVWRYATDKNGFPIRKFHAFGDTAAASLLTFPWYSADSATWMIQSGRAARIKLQGKAYQLRSKMIGDTSYLDNNDPKPKKLAWEEEIRKLGMDPDVVMNAVVKPSEMSMIRCYLIASDLLYLQEATRPVTAYKKARALFKRSYDEVGIERDGPCKVYYASSPAAFYFIMPVIAALKIDKILFSYYYISTSSKTFWDKQLVPFLMDPQGHCERDEKLRPFWDKLNSCLLKPVGV